MLPALIELFFGCKHEFGFPVTNPGTQRTYQVCLRCGREYEYDWEQMIRLPRTTRKTEAGSYSRTHHRTALP